MKRSKFLRTIALLGALVSGGYFAFDEDIDKMLQQDNKPMIYNYTGVDFTVADSVEVLSQKNVVKHSVREYRLRDLEGKCFTIWVHHLGVPSSSSISGVMNYHVNSHGWPAIGYHSGIAENGDVYLFNTLETISYHTRGQNTSGISIVLWGDYRDKYPTVNQIRSLIQVINAIEEVVCVNKVSAHKLAPGAKTTCPSDNVIKTLKYYEIIE